MKRFLSCLVLVALFAYAQTVNAAEKKPASEPKTGIEGQEIITRSGDYAAGTLEITRTLQKGTATFTIAGGLRNGVWTVSDGVGVREPGGTLKFANGRLSGTVRRVEEHGDLVIDLPVENGVVSGQATWAGEKVAVQGRIIPEADLAKNNAIPNEISWPSFLGNTGGGMAVQSTPTPTIDDPAQIKLVWGIEEFDIGRGMGNINRFMTEWKFASTIRTGSGASSFLLKDGKLFIRYFVPTPDGPKDPNAKIFQYNIAPDKAAESMLAEAKAAGWQGAELPEYAKEKLYINCDEIMLCSDAATGKTLWKSILHGRGRNMQHHKFGAFNHTPVFANGKLFGLTTSGLLYALDAATGKGLWESQVSIENSVALIAIGNAVIAPAEGAFGAYDMATGKLLWKAGTGRRVTSLAPWTHEGKNYLLGSTTIENNSIACLDAETGKTLWSIPEWVATSGRGYGPGGITVFGDTMLVGTWNHDPKGEKALSSLMQMKAYSLTPEKPELLWALASKPKSAEKAADAPGVKAAKPKGGKNDDEGGDEDVSQRGVIHPEALLVVLHGKYVFTADLRVVDIKTGKVVSEATGIIPENGGYVQTMNDLVFVRRDGTHGAMLLGLYKVSPEGHVKNLAEKGWTPPAGGSTTSYHHPIFYPMADGRIFCRQSDGIFCWDFRAH